MAVITYKCPNCGGDLRFDPQSQKYRCEYCLSQFDSAEGLEDGAEKAPGTEAPGGGGDGSPVLYNCPSCGAEIVTDENTAATFCYYCHNPVVLAGRMQGEYHPDYVIPFAVDRKKALEIFGQWIRKKKYIPKSFYSNEQIEKMTGVYFPYWLYSCRVEGKLDAEGVKRKTWATGRTQYTQTEKYDVIREGQMQVEHVTRNALSKANRSLVEGVLPFGMEKLQPFEMGYLSGFQAERRDLGEDKFRPEIRQEVKGYAEQALQSGVGGYDAVQVRSQEARLEDERWDYALMPVWTLTYKDPKQGKIYYFACNGQTGKVCGELPVDMGRLAGLFASVFAPVFLGLLLVGYFL